jgi:hypothetical protein
VASNAVVDAVNAMYAMVFHLMAASAQRVAGKPCLGLVGLAPGVGEVTVPALNKV